jgi:hypothetical protein
MIRVSKNKLLFLAGMILTDIAIVTGLLNVLLCAGNTYIYFITGILFGAGMVFTLVYLYKLRNNGNRKSDTPPVSQ